MIATPSIPRRYTLADYETMPYGPPYYQLIDGELVMSPAPKSFHQTSVMRLSRSLGNFVEKHNAGEVFVSPIDVYFTNTDVYQPDIVFIATERLDIIGEANIQGAPDIVMEMLSSNAKYDLGRKKNVYEAYGVKEYWIIDTKRKSIDILENVLEQQTNEFRLSSQTLNGVGTVQSSVLAGFEITLEYVFAPFGGVSRGVMRGQQR
jgi:Uma2 family endonuclease